MKKFYLSLLATLLSVTLYAVDGPAGTITAEDVNIKVGKSAVIAVVYESTEPRISIGGELLFSEAGLTVTKVETATAENGGICVDQAFSFSNPGENLFRFGATSASNSSFTDIKGVIAYITIQDDGTHSVGQTISATFQNWKLGTGSPDGAVLPPSYTFTITFTEDKLDLYDTATEAPAASSEQENVVLHREFKANKWNTLVVPFDVDADGVKAAFGDDVVLAEFTGYKSPTNNNNPSDEEEIVLEFTTTTTLSAGVPVLIKPSTAKTEVNFTVDGINPVEPATEFWDGLTTGPKNKQWQCTATMQGTYVQTTIQNDEDLWQFPVFLNNNQFYYAKAAQTLKGYRAYFILDSNPLYDNAAVKMAFDVEGETAIVAVDDDIENGKTYTVDGKYLGENVKLNRMQKGIYIVNGKKVINK